MTMSENTRNRQKFLQQTGSTDQVVDGMTNIYGIPMPIVRAVSNDNYSKGSSDFSVTDLLQPPQLLRLKQIHQDEIVEDVSERIWALLGTAIHAILERSTSSNLYYLAKEMQAEAASSLSYLLDHDTASNVDQELLDLLNTLNVTTAKIKKICYQEMQNNHVEIPEERYYAKITVDGTDYVISGKLDLIEQVTLSDYKVTSVWSVIYDTDDWEYQLNMYGFLATLNGKSISSLRIVAILRDWQQRKAKQSSSYPQCQVATLTKPCWDQHRRLAFIAERIRLHTAETPRECTDTERWYSGTTYAVKKGTNKRATRVFDHHHEAQSYIDNSNTQGLWIETRRGENKRCESYCPVAQFCPQFKRLSQES